MSDIKFYSRTPIKMIVFILFTIFLGCSSEVIKIIDPNSMDFDDRYIKMEKLRKSSSYKVPSGYCERSDNSMCDTHFKRIMRVLIQNAHLHKEGDHHVGHINLRFSERDYNLLNSLVKKEIFTNDDYDEVRTILEATFQKTNADKYFDVVLSLQERMYLAVFNEKMGILFITLLFIYVVYKMFKAHYTWKAIMRYLAFAGYLIDYAITHLQLLEVEQVEQQVTMKRYGSIPPECDPNKMSWVQYFKHLYNARFSETDCSNYYKVIYQNPLFRVTPLKVVTHQLETIMVKPMKDFGTGFAEIYFRICDVFPFGLGYILSPLMLIGAIFLVATVLLIILDREFEIKYMLFSFRIGRSSITKKNFKRVGEEHRMFVQDIKDMLTSNSARGGGGDNKSVNNLEAICSKCKHETKKLKEKDVDCKDNGKNNLETNAADEEVVEEDTETVNNE